MISLIANSGIQLHTVPISIDLDNRGDNLLFYEWFDPTNSKYNFELATYLGQNNRIYKRSELERTQCIDTINGALTVPEAAVLSIPDLKAIYQGNPQNCQLVFSMSGSSRHSKIDSLYNQWLPLPYFENGAAGAVKQGPYNWCRFKIAPDATDGNTLQGTLILAFDTHATYGKISTDNFSECPDFDDNENDKLFTCCQQPSMLLDFCAGPNIWITEALMELVHGVDLLDKIQTNTNRGQHKYDFLATYLWLINYLSKNANLPQVRLIRDRGVQKEPVEMIIDIGNSRTAAILYEGEFSNVKPLSLQNFTHILSPNGNLNRSEESFDMRVAFQKVDFGCRGHNLGSSQFVWPSIVRLGSEAQHLTFRTALVNDGDEMFSTYSSPKRYLWDNKRRKEEWRCVKTDETGKNELPSIRGISNMFNDDGSLADNKMGYGYHYSRKTLMTLAFMEILSQANVQINSFSYRDDRGKRSTPRFLNKVILTCPTGMSKQEQHALHNCLNDALHVLAQFYNSFDDSYTPQEVMIEPNLNANDGWMYDEATCSQFVFLYGLLTETYQNCSKELFEINGKVRDGKDSLILGSLDIGAGTSDITICRYDYDPTNSSRMKPIPLFWDSFDIAGDDMLQILISNVLLQGKDGLLEQKLMSIGLPESAARGKLFEFMGRNQRDHKFIEKNLRRDFNLQVLIPIMYEFLRLHSNGVLSRDVAFDDLFSVDTPSPEVRDRFKHVFGFELKDMTWHYDRDVMTHHIAASLDKNLLEKVAVIMADPHLYNPSERHSSATHLSKVPTDSFASITTTSATGILLLTNSTVVSITPKVLCPWEP